jgi:hypothetical protein
MRVDGLVEGILEGTGQMIHENSTSAFAETKELRERRRAVILQFYADHETATDREVMMGLGLPERNCVAPRITEMIEEGLVLEVGTATDLWTGRPVRICRKALA